MGVESAWHALKSKTGGSTNLRPSWASTKSWTAGTTLSGLHSCTAFYTLHASWTAKVPDAKACPGHAVTLLAVIAKKVRNSTRHVLQHDAEQAHVQHVCFNVLNYAKCAYGLT